ncbi:MULTISPECIES: hypothetical protein [unclassified Corynebacterium]|uniref:hypothetical protein n=1 Tax=unclassified Corynebacterium TaxID=2624378 RepID=UPI0030A95B64
MPTNRRLSFVSATIACSALVLSGCATDNTTAPTSGEAPQETPSAPAPSSTIDAPEAAPEAGILGGDDALLCNGASCDATNGGFGF